MSERPLYRVKVACVDKDGRNVVSNQYVHSETQAGAMLTATDRVRAMGALRIDTVVKVDRGTFVPEEGGS